MTSAGTLVLLLSVLLAIAAFVSVDAATPGPRRKLPYCAVNRRIKALLQENGAARLRRSRSKRGVSRYVSVLLNITFSFRLAKLSYSYKFVVLELRLPFFNRRTRLGEWNLLLRAYWTFGRFVTFISESLTGKAPRTLDSIRQNDTARENPVVVNRLILS